MQSDSEFCSRTWEVDFGQLGGAVKVQECLRQINYRVRACNRIFDTTEHGFVLPLFFPPTLLIIS